MRRSTHLATLTLKLSESLIRSEDAHDGSRSFALLAVERDEDAAVLSGPGNVDSVGAAERTVGSKLRSRLRQCIIEGNELDVLQGSERLCCQAATYRIAARSADRRRNLGQDQIRHNDWTLLLIERFQKVAANNMKRISRISVTSEDVCFASRVSITREPCLQGDQHDAGDQD